MDSVLPGIGKARKHSREPRRKVRIRRPLHDGSLRSQIAAKVSVPAPRASLHFGLAAPRRRGVTKSRYTPYMVDGELRSPRQDPIVVWDYDLRAMKWPMPTISIGSMSWPRCCPVCGEHQLQPVLRKAIISAQIGDEDNAIPGALAFRCANGHIFITVPESSNQREPTLV